MFQIINRETMANPTIKDRDLVDPDVLLEIGLLARNGNLAVDAAPVQLFSRVLHNVRIGGVWKCTHSGRLRKTEHMICNHTAPDLRSCAEVLDLGASDGVTTVELIRALRSAWNSEVEVYLTDLNLWLERFRFGAVVEYRSTTGEPVMARIGRIGLRLALGSNECEAERDPLSRSYLRLVRLRQRMRLDARISLVNPVATREPGVTIMELNCLVRAESLVGRFAAVRASNVLNLGYFSPTEIAQAVAHLHAYLCEEGCLVVSRNDNQTAGELENGSVWRKRGDRLYWLEDFGSGSEVKAIVNG